MRYITGKYIMRQKENALKQNKRCAWFELECYKVHDSYSDKLESCNRKIV